MLQAYWRYGVPLLLLQGLAGCGAAEVAEKTAGAERTAPDAAAEPAFSDAAIAAGPLIVALGDSLYAGYRLPARDGLAPELQRRLRQQGIAATVVNAGVSGDTSAAGRARLAYVLDGQARTPTLVIIGLGGNDLLRGLPVAQTRANLAAMLTELRRRGIPAMLTGMRAPPNLGPEYVAAFDAIYPELAAEYGAPLHPFLLDGVIGQSALMLDDGIHPNAAGVDRIAAAMVPAVVAALPDQPTPPPAPTGAPASATAGAPPSAR